MLSFVVILGAILLLAVNLRLLSGLSLSYLLAPSIFLVAFWVYIFGLFGQLSKASELAIVLILFMTSILIWRKRNGLSILVKDIFSPHLLVFVVLSWVSYKRTKDWQMSQWDEFSHWGTVVRAMYEFGNLSASSPADLRFPEYPPGLASFQYFVIDLHPTWNEGLLLWSLHLIAFSVLLGMIGLLSFRSPFASTVKLLSISLASTIILNFYFTLYADPLLSIIFASSIFLAIKTADNTKLVLAFVPTLIFLTLVKPTGIFFAFFATSIYFLSSFLQNSDSDSPDKVYRFKLTSLMLFACLCTYVSWAKFVSLNNASNTKSSLSNAFSFLADESNSSFVSAVVMEYVYALFSREVSSIHGFKLSAYSWTLICGVVLAFWVFLSEKNLRRRRFLLAVFVFFITLLYLALVLLLYIVVFGEYEARGLASYSRYIGTWFQAIFLAFSCLVISDNRSQLRTSAGSRDSTTFSERGNARLVIFALVGFQLILSSESSAYNATKFENYRNGSKLREIYQPMMVKIAAEDIPNGSNVWIIAQHTVGFDYWVLRYELINSRFAESWSIGSPKDSSDVWTNQTVTPKEWSRSLSSYDYVILYSTSKDFNENYAHIFSNGVVETNSIYRVNKSDGKILLQKAH